MSVIDIVDSFGELSHCRRCLQNNTLVTIAIIMPMAITKARTSGSKLGGEMGRE